MSNIHESLCRYYRKGKCIHPSKKEVHNFLDDMGAVKGKDVYPTAEQSKKLDKLLAKLPTGEGGTFNLATREMYCSVITPRLTALDTCNKHRKP